MSALDFTTFSNIINNELKSTTATRHGIDPATLKALPEVPVSTQEDLDAAVSHAKIAFKSWSKTTLEERRKCLNEFADAFEKEREGFARLLVQEQGKPLQTANIEITMTLQWIREMPKQEIPEEVIEDTAERKIVHRWVPLGVCGGLVPWNWPILLGLGKMIPALYTGNTFIMKPSPFTPYCDLKLCELATRVFPPGVFQCLSGGDDLGPMFTLHPGIDKIAFTGSTETGKKVMESCAKTLKRVTLELGGNDAAIVCKDVDLEKIVPQIAIAAFLNSSQICMVIKRLYVHAEIYKEFKTALIAFLTNAVKTGPGFDEGVLVGPIQNSMQYAKVQDLYSEIDKEGWKVAIGGNTKPVCTSEAPGYFMTPTVIDNPPEDSRIVQEEPFGPIIPLLRWEEEEEVIARANASVYGLGASVWSRDMKQCERMAVRLESGSVWCNSHFVVLPNVPFGGHKSSGIGMEWGVTGLKAYCNPQTIWFAQP